MYNRYVPQSDGTYQRNRMRESQTAQPSIPVCPNSPPEQPHPRTQPDCQRCPHRPLPRRKNDGAGNFLRGLLPEGLETEDLLIILLLLLMSGQDREDRNLPLLTLALYLFL